MTNRVGSNDGSSSGKPTAPAAGTPTAQPSSTPAPTKPVAPPMQVVIKNDDPAKSSAPLKK